MNEERARELLKGLVDHKEWPHSLTWHRASGLKDADGDDINWSTYVSMHPVRIVIDGPLSADELEAITWWYRQFFAPAQPPSPNTAGNTDPPTGTSTTPR